MDNLLELLLGIASWIVIGALIVLIWPIAAAVGITLLIIKILED